jgi:hypothetical protein
MKGGMKEDSSRSDDAQEFVALNTPLKPDAVGDTPPSCSSRNPTPFRAVSEDSQHCLRMPNETHRANRQSSAFPGEETRCENDVASSTSAEVDIPDIHCSCIREHAHPSGGPDDSSRIGILCEGDESALLREACGPNSDQQAASDDAADLVDQASPAKLRE